MKVELVIPKLKLYLYDRDFLLFAKFFTDNLSEKELNVSNKNTSWNIRNDNIWNFLDIKIE